MRKSMLVAAGGLFVTLAAVLYWFDPAQVTFYPRCQFHDLTGLYCPGCGTTRCAHALLHGQISQAAAYNVLFLVCLVLFLSWLVHASVSVLMNRPPIGNRVPPWCVWLFFSIVIAFGILRNLPFSPFDVLAPHQVVRPVEVTAHDGQLLLHDLAW